MATAPQLTLQCSRGSTTGQTYEVPEAGLLLGRRDDCDIQFDHNVDVKVSGHHARIEPAQGGWVFIDLGSTNGSLVNGVPVQPNTPTPISSGTVIELGEDRSDGTIAFQAAVAGQPSATGPSTAQGESVEATCPHCQQQMMAPKSMIGRAVQCDHCNETFEVPITTKLFHNKPAGGGFASPAGGQDTGETAPSAGSSSDDHADKGRGIFGKVKNAVKNFREKREVQEELTTQEAALQSQNTEADTALVELGRIGWSADSEACAGLPGGDALVSMQSEAKQLEEDAEKAQAVKQEAESALEEATERWADQVEKADSECAGLSADSEQAAEALNQASSAFRAALAESLACLDSVAESHQQLQSADPLEFDYKPQFDALAALLSESASTTADAWKQLKAPHKAVTDADKAASKAQEALAKAQQASADAKQQRDGELGELREALEGVEAEARRLTQAYESTRSKFDPHFRALGTALIQQGGGGVVAPDAMEYNKASSACERRDQTDATVRELRARLMEL